MSYALEPIGRVVRDATGVRVEIDPAYRDALLGLDRFSHVTVLTWLEAFDTDEGRGTLQCDPPYAPDHRTGVFACRSPLRPNPIAATVCPISGVDLDDGVVDIADIDTYVGTPVIDLKAYFPVCDRVREATIPEWLTDWPEWLPDEGIGLQEDDEHELETAGT